MEPMDLEEDAVGISVADNPERSPAIPTERPEDVAAAHPAGASAACASSAEMHVDEAPPDPRRGALCAPPADTLDDSPGFEDMCKPHVGVTAEVNQAAAEPIMVLRKEALVVRLRKMVIGVSNGPVPSGEGAAVASLTLGDLKLVKQVVATLNLKTNADVHAACGCLDDQEGRAFLAADLIGIQLVRGLSQVGNSRGNEARRLGEEIDERLAAHEAALDKLGSTARQKKSRARKAEGADDKVAAIDVKLASDKAALAAAVVVLERLPDAKVKIEVKRERPPKPAPVAPLQTHSQRRTKVVKAEEAAARADALEDAARRRYEKAKAATAKVGKKRLEQSMGGWRLDDEAYKRLLAERAETDREWEQLCASEQQLLREWIEARQAAGDARDAASEARSDVAIESEWQRSWAALELKWQQRDAELRAARDAERAAEVAEAAEEERVWEAAREEEAREAERWLAERRAERERESRELHREIARSQWTYSRPEVVRNHAQHVWGAGWEKENSAPPKVFRLVGKSADEVRSVAHDVSQTVTDTEERVRLNRVEHEMLH